MLLIAIGFSVAALGTLIGVGGGFILVPLLLVLYPEQSHVWIVSVSMWLVAANASSGSVTYYLKRKVHLRAAVIFILAAFPGSLTGIWVEQFLSRQVFEIIFGVVLIFYSVFLFFKKTKKQNESTFTPDAKLDNSLYVKGALISFGVGFVGSLLGIGGGVIHVPLLIHVLEFPVHMATGTSHFILAATALFTTAAHIWNGDLDLRSPVLWQLGLSAIVGAQVGAALSPKVSGAAILRFLAVALFLVGLRLLFTSARQQGWI